jgi:hypothetical protein
MYTWYFTDLYLHVASGYRISHYSLLCQWKIQSLTNSCLTNDKKKILFFLKQGFSV